MKKSSINKKIQGVRTQKMLQEAKATDHPSINGKREKVYPLLNATSNELEIKLASTTTENGQEQSAPHPKHNTHTHTGRPKKSYQHRGG
uniref:Uncharacterized protein n=1 Tax=Rhizophora mucronata TaxID=61149 RepID=A0A2P2PB00_RHIMU